MVPNGKRTPELKLSARWNPNIGPLWSGLNSSSSMYLVNFMLGFDRICSKVLGPRYTIRYSAGYSIRYSYLDYLMEYLIVYRTKNNTSDI